MRQEPFHFAKDKDGNQLGTPPKKLTKGLRRHLKKVARGNKAEVEYQRTMIG